MNIKQFLGLLEESLGVQHGSINLDDTLTASPYWDSMAALTFMSLADQQCHVSVSGEQVQRCVSMRDLIKLLGDKITE